MEQNNLIASVLLLTAVLELLVMPFVMSRIKGQQKLIVGFAMFSGSVITAAIGAAFYIGWIGGA